MQTNIKKHELYYKTIDFFYIFACYIINSMIHNMKKKHLLYATAIAIFSLGENLKLHAQNTSTSQMEYLTRGVVAIPCKDGGEFISWRMLGTDPLNTSFDVMRDGVVIASNIKNRTNYTDTSGNKNSTYQIVTKVNGIATHTTSSVHPWTEVYKTIKLNRPTGGTDPVSKGTYVYTPNDCSVGDVDGDGEYEIVVQWQPSNSTTNSNEGIHPGIEYIDCYRMDGEQLWRIDMGPNILAGDHHTQFLVYDFDGNGCAEIILKTAPGTRDGKGNYVNSVADDSEILAADNNKDWRASGSAAIQGGQEYLTVFNGKTGEAIHTIFYNPNRDAGYGGAADGKQFNWDDRNGKNDYVASYGNRGNRFLATVAYLDGKDELPSAVMCRGYYTQSFLWAVDFRNNKLSHKWLHASVSKTNVERTNANWEKETRSYNSNTFNDSHGYNTAYGQGNHNLSVADVDGDGCDEIIYGGATIDNDGWLLYSTGLGHGDAIHVADMLPDRPGYEVFRCLESSPYGIVMYDAKSGEKLFYQTADGDTGRGLAANISSVYRGYEFWGASGNYPRESESGNFEMFYNKYPSINFRIYWDGDLLDELYDGTFNSDVNKATPNIQKWNGSSFDRTEIAYNGSQSCNHTKATPNLQADLLGDWREELIMWNYDNPEEINILTTNIPSNYRVPTLMHDHNYRLAITWQNSGYNQPPHLGYYLPDANFDYPTYNTTSSIVWENTFEDASSFANGWDTPNISTQQKLLKNDNYALLLDQNAGGGDRAFNYPLTDKNFAASIDYTFEFDWAINPSNQHNSTLTLLGDNATTLFKLVNANYAGVSTIYAGDESTVLGTITNNTRDNYGSHLIINHFIIKGNENGVTLTVTQGDENRLISDVELSPIPIHLTKIEGVLGRAYSHMIFDNFKLSHRELTIIDGEDFTATGTYANVSYERMFNTAYNYGTICLPFAPDETTCANYHFYKLDQYNATTLTFVEETAPQANTAYLYCLKNGIEAETAKTITGGQTTVSSEIVTSEGDWKFIGSLTKQVIASNNTCYVYAPDKDNNSNNNERISVVKGNLTVNPYRAYFNYTGSAYSNMSTMRIIIKGTEENTTSIQEINPEEIEGLTSPAIYDLMGRRVKQMKKNGIYIINGKKMIWQ